MLRGCATTRRCSRTLAGTMCFATPMQAMQRQPLVWIGFYPTPTKVCFVLLNHSTIYYRFVKRKNIRKNFCRFGRPGGPPVILADTLIVLRISTRHYIYSTLFLRKLSADLKPANLLRPDSITHTIAPCQDRMETAHGNQSHSRSGSLKRLLVVL
jgi:hypothetical protein